MAYSESAPTTIHRTRPRVLRAVIAIVLVATPAAVALHLLAGHATPVDQRPSALLPHGKWPAQGQAAIVVGDGRTAASPNQRPAPIASLAKVMTAYLTLERYPLGGDEVGFTMPSARPRRSGSPKKPTKASRRCRCRRASG